MQQHCITLLFFEIFIFENCFCKQESEMMCNYDLYDASTDSSKITAASNTTSKVAVCDKQLFIKGLSNMGVANPEDVGILPSSSSNVDVLCSRITESLKRMIPTATSCVTDDEIIYFRTLLNGMSALSHKLCGNTSLRGAYKLSERCLNKLYWEFEECEGSAQWICDTNETFVCDTYRKIQTCVFLKAGVLCGWAGANIMNMALRDATDNMLRKKCKNVRCDPEIPKDIVFAKLRSSHLSVEMHYILCAVFLSTFLCFFNRV